VGYGYRVMRFYKRKYFCNRAENIPEILKEAIIIHASEGTSSQPFSL
jgi:hypothetical protein